VFFVTPYPGNVADGFCDDKYDHGPLITPSDYDLSVHDAYQPVLIKSFGQGWARIIEKQTKRCTINDGSDSSSEQEYRSPTVM
jgi:hypothetical protein